MVAKSAITWLKDRGYGFDTNLGPTSRRRIYDFFILWAFFEFKAFECSANMQLLERFCITWLEVGNPRPLSHEEFEYFRQRYWAAPDAIARREALLNRPNRPERPVIERGFNDAATPLEQMQAVMAVLYRLRNNLFHGEKARYEFAEQDENFRHANSVLKKAINEAQRQGQLVR